MSCQKVGKNDFVEVTVKSSTEIEIKEIVETLVKPQELTKDELVISNKEVFINLSGDNSLVHGNVSGTHFSKQGQSFEKAELVNIVNDSYIFRNEKGYHFFIKTKDADGKVFRSEISRSKESFTYEITHKSDGTGMTQINIHLKGSPKVSIASLVYRVAQNTVVFSRFDTIIEYRRLGLSEILLKRALELDSNIDSFVVTLTSTNALIFRETFLELIKDEKIASLKKDKKYEELLNEYFMDFVTSFGREMKDAETKLTHLFGDQILQAVYATPAYKIRAKLGFKKLLSKIKLDINFNDREDLEIEVKFTVSK